MFTIIVPVFNVQEYIQECLKSLQLQSIKNFEVIIVNDGSTDNSEEICQEFVDRNSNFKLFRKKNGGLSDARNYGLSKANGEYIIFLDSDDLLDQSAVEKFTNFIDSSQTKFDIISGNAKVIGTDKQYLYKNLLEKDYGIYSGIDYYLKSLKKNSLYVPTWLHIFKKDFLLENKLFFKKGIYHEDEDHTVRCYLKAEYIVDFNIVHYLYRIRSGSITNSSSNLFKRIEDLKITYDDLRKEVIKINNTSLLREFDNYWASVFFHYALIEYKAFGKNEKILRRNVFSIYTRGTNRVKKILFIISPKLLFNILLKKNS